MKDDSLPPPFRTGEIVSDEFFTDRASEVTRIRRAMRGAERLLVYGERRQGKSSAIRQASLPIVRGGGVVASADLWTLQSMGELVARIVSAIPYRWSLRDRFMMFLAQAGLEPAVTIDGAGQPAFSLGVRRSRLDEARARDLLRSVISGLDGMAADAPHPVVLVLDEFQRIEEISEGGGALLRGIVQETPRLGYILAGSALSLVDDLVAPGGPFYSIDRLDIGPIEPVHLARWIEDRMRGRGVEPDGGTGAHMVELAGPRTEYCVRLARECFLRGRVEGRVTVAGAESSFRDLVREATHAYELLWAELAPSQQGVLRAVAAGQRHLHSVEARDRFDLPTSGSITKAIHLLRRRSYLSSGDPADVADPFFKAWILWTAMPDGRPRS